MSHAWIGLGSNVGAREEHLSFALARLLELGVEVLRVSHVYETRPAPPAAPTEPPYLNAVLQADTDRDPLDLLRLLHAIEAERGRDEARRAGPRMLDLDLLALGSIVVDGTELILPHPRLLDRAFVLVPLCELDPLWRHPALDLNAAELLARLEVDPGEVRCVGALSRPAAHDVEQRYPWRLLSPAT